MTVVVMFVSKQFLFCASALIAVQVLSVDGGPTLSGRGLFDAVTDPIGTLSNGVNHVDNGLRRVRAAGRSALVGTVGKGVELATGVNPANILDLPKNAAKTAIRGARLGTEVTAGAAQGALDTALYMHDRKKQLLEDWVLPVAPTMVGDAINGANNVFDSTVLGLQDRVQNGKDHVVGRLNAAEDWLDNGPSLVPNVVKDGLSTARSATNWLGSWIPGWSSTGAPAGAGGKGGQPGQPGTAGGNWFGWGNTGGQARGGQGGKGGQPGQPGQKG
ncbi:uncharacterized protein [Bemisia tabaci]|uniref:uncharacterized protein n=1 Tax=Bemisia tabaci TaxID=7038 RepID=UPI003B289976